MDYLRKKIVCLGGGIGTVNLITGLKNYFHNIAVVISMADDGGSSGRLRRLYNVPPPGDLVSCMAAIASTSNPVISKMLKYRFSGNRYGKDADLSGQKLGNLIMIALKDITGNFNEAIKLFQKTFGIEGVFLPATLQTVNISAKTIEGKKIYGETKIDLGKYKGKRVLERVYLEPASADANPEVLKSIEEADVIIAGPGDLYTTILPVLIVEKINDALKKSPALKIFIVNVANKPFETKGYSVFDYINAVEKHLGAFPFSKVIVNNNFAPKIPKKYNYHYIDINQSSLNKYDIIKEDIVDEAFPLYHNPSKLAKIIVENI
ncbi:MAG: hypothetical protein A3D74_04405 [Candidatus Levybacteria bacterium RIFCSPHIGHO2_02_FULL_37_13]|nr:MAG: hypothetical protein A3D74_04405 [Candidatus Levybacteria bacterium RIFCSPHIGHO2_02_FULL_37_13]OGH30614.1 MAG: hypothetical protein A3E40_01705 [Candidatus Levybacteria bacterium RIFCSPHIGHO2_12_FULL_37_9]OGH40687.1 MAG: hypothetical protein A3B41_03020 [Candidatus Levybacteria bacterium RIFCSPLOWO2_01_FULL_37_26]